MKKRIQKILAFLLVVMLVVQGSVNLNASEPAVEETTEITVEATDQVEKQAEKEKEKATTEADKDETQTTTEAQKEEEKATTEEAEEQTSAEEVTTETQKEEKAAEAATQATTEATVSEEETTVTEPTTEAAAEATTEAKAEPKTAFSYEDNRVIITAIAKKEANFPENTELKARYIKKGSDEYNTAVNTIKEQTEIDDEQFLDFVCYDVYFEVDGKEVEPEAGMVKVTIKYKNPIFQGVADEATNYITYHITDSNKVEDVTGTVKTNDDGAVTSVGFSTESFSEFVSAALIFPYKGADLSQAQVNYNKFGLGFEKEPTNWRLGNANWSTLKFLVRVTYKDDNGVEQTKDQIAQCLQSMFATPNVDGSYKSVSSEEIQDFLLDPDNSEQIQNLQKILYYGSSDSPGYVGTKFLEFNKDYIISKLGQPAYDAICANPEDFFFVMTHVAASYQYYSSLGSPYHPNTDLSAEECAFWGVNLNGREVINAWSEYLISQTERGLKLLRNGSEIGDTFIDVDPDDVYELQGNPADNKVTIIIPEGLQCIVTANGNETTCSAGRSVAIYPGNTFKFSVVGYTGTSLEIESSQELRGVKSESASIAIINYGDDAAKGDGAWPVQDIGLLTSIDTSHNTSIQLKLKWQKGAFQLTKTGKDGVPLQGVKFDVFSDSNCNERIASIETDKDGKAYLEVAISEAIAENNYNIYLKETEPAKGYALDDTPHEVTLIPIDTKEVEDSSIVDVSIQNEALSVKVNKTDITGEKEVAGATISICKTNDDGKPMMDEVVASWTSDGNGPYDFGSELEAGKTYRLVETVAPDGYAYTESITFTVNSDGTVNVNRDNVSDNTILMKDDLTFLSVNKVDKNGAPVAGAKLVIRDAAGKPVTDILTSGKEAIVVRGLAAGKYILSEIESPDGYSVSADVWFEVSDKYDPEHKINTVTMTDEEENNAAKGKVTVTKTLSLGDKDLPIGAKDTVFYVALFSDAERTQRVSDVKPLIFKNQSTTTAVFEKLEAGIYYVGETDAYGNLIDANAEDALFIPQYIDGYVAEITSTVFEVSKSINNRFPTLPEGYYYEGTLNITKKVLKGTEAWATDNVYYAGVFTDAACTQKATDPIKLAMNGSSETTAKVTVPLGEDPKTVVTYYVAETDENGVVLQNGNSIPFTISIDGSKAELSGEYNTKNVTITNTYDADGYYNEEDSDTDTNEKSESSKSTKSKKTGDNTQIMLYIMLFAAALLGCMGVTLRRKGRHSR